MSVGIFILNIDGFNLAVKNKSQITRMPTHARRGILPAAWNIPLITFIWFPAINKTQVCMELL